MYGFEAGCALFGTFPDLLAHLDDFSVSTWTHLRPQAFFIFHCRALRTYSSRTRALIFIESAPPIYNDTNRIDYGLAPFCPSHDIYPERNDTLQVLIRGEILLRVEIGGFALGSIPRSCLTRFKLLSATTDE